ncbi:L-type lectin-domain containing receptor kinase SIT2-like [Nymphaea colorata]|uniref:L-type lectin-domain containing receptor kinase SIT2-like n=1 Tax=Nymphaea colorata TaxID=210225 RepID=UPI00129E31F7|nr:L-type lectin-domain containing receptor kinase SIT2-like [Nymphaea colorata]
MDYPHRLPYRKIYRAAKGFKEELGKGGFGSVYKGLLPRSGIEVAVKRVSHGSKQGMREFVAEVSSLGRTRHRNLIQLHDGKLGDFGHAKLYDHGTNPKSTHVVGSLGYMASELPRASKSKMSSDVYSYGSLLLEVACGRRLIEPGRPSEEMILVELVHSQWKGGRILDAMDKRLGTSYVVEEVEQWRSNMVAGTAPESRPNMRQLTQSLIGYVPLQDPEHRNLGIHDQGMNQLLLQYPSPDHALSTSASSVSYEKALLTSGNSGPYRKVSSALARGLREGGRRAAALARKGLAGGGGIRRRRRRGRHWAKAEEEALGSPEEEALGEGGGGGVGRRRHRKKAVGSLL